MGEHDIAHVIVMADGQPAGVLSTLDVARAVTRR
jgi:signal-transduction protein with cAMP-binding, CBS, and nucleotidyltransferase domain